MRTIQRHRPLLPRPVLGLLALFLISPLASAAGESCERTYLLGDWGGLRTRLASSGYQFDAAYTSEYLWNLRGGARTGSDYRADLSLSLSIDTGAAGWWADGTFFVHLQGQHGNGITEEFVQDFQVLSNIDADDFFQVSELWYQHAFFDGQLTLKLGKLEGNADFAFVAYGGIFSNSSAGFSPTIPLVTYPDQDWGLVLGLAPAPWFSMNAGVYQGRPDGDRSLGNTLDNLYGPMIMVEPAFHYTLGERPGSLRLGGWWNGDRFARLGPEEDAAGPDPEAWLALTDSVRTSGLLTTFLTELTGFAGERLTGALSQRILATDTTKEFSYGFYVTVDQEVYREHPEDAEDTQGIGLFAQFGWSDDDTFEAEQYHGLGLQWTGAIPWRDADVAGLGVFHVLLSNEAEFEKRHETAVECYYHLQLTPWLSLRPDLQYILNPGGSGNPDAIAAGLRTQISF